MLKNYTGETAQLVNENLAEKKELTHVEKMALFGYLFDVFNHNYDLFSELGIESVSVLYDNSMIQNNEFRFFCGDGVALGNELRLDSMFFNKNNVLVFSVFDDSQDGKELFYI